MILPVGAAGTFNVVGNPSTSYVNHYERIRVTSLLKLLFHNQGVVLLGCARAQRGRWGTRCGTFTGKPIKKDYAYMSNSW